MIVFLPRHFIFVAHLSIDLILRCDIWHELSLDSYCYNMLVNKGQGQGQYLGEGLGSRVMVGVGTQDELKKVSWGEN